MMLEVTVMFIPVMLALFWRISFEAGKAHRIKPKRAHMFIFDDDLSWLPVADLPGFEYNLACHLYRDGRGRVYTKKELYDQGRINRP